MAYSWERLGASILRGLTTGIEERTEEAKEFVKTEKEAANRSIDLIKQRERNAMDAAQLGKRAMQLGASPSQVRTAMASGMKGVAELHDKLQEAASQKGVKKLGVDDIEAIVNMPNIPGVQQSLADMSLEEFARQTYGATKTKPAVTEEDKPSFAKTLFGYDKMSRAEKDLEQTKLMNDLSVADVNRMARQSEYQSLFPGATITFTDIDYFTPDEALDFSSKLTKAMSDAEDGDAAEAYIKAKVRAAGADMDARATAEKNARAFLRGKAAKPLIEYFADTYSKGGFFENKLVLKQIEDTMGAAFLQDLMEVYGYDTETEESIEETTSAPELVVERPTIKIEETLRKEPEVTPEEDTEDPALKPDEPLTEEGKAIVEQALSGQLIKGYTAKYTRDQWDNMSRKERKERGLPESRLGIVGFDFKEDIDEMLEKPLRNLNIKRNLDSSKEYKVKIKGRGTFTVTGEQLATMDDAAFTMPYKPAIEISEYEEGEEKARKITTRILERYQVGE